MMFVVFLFLFYGSYITRFELVVMEVMKEGRRKTGLLVSISVLWVLYLLQI